MKPSIELTLSEIVRKFPASAALFEKYDLDYCCHGKVTLKEACSDNPIKYQKVEHALHRLFENDWTNTAGVHYESVDLNELVDHIVNKHHVYVKESLPMILAHLEKVSTKHGDKHPELYDIYQLFAEIKSDFEQHMFKEENILFPRIKEVNNAFKNNADGWIPDRHYVDAAIHVMQGEHDKAGSMLHEIKKLSNNYSAPENACTTYRLSFDELKAFEYDLHQHVHLENNILFPKAIELEKKLRNTKDESSHSASYQ